MNKSNDINSVIEAASRKICSHYTYPVFTKDYRERPDLKGSAVAIGIEGAIFLVTAAHVVKGKAEKIERFAIGTPKGIINIEGKYTVTEPDPRTGIDKYDICIVALSSEFCERNDLQYIDDSNLNVAGFYEPGLTSFIFGFPVSRNKQAKSLKKNAFHTLSYGYAGKIIEDPNTYIRNNRSDSIHTCMSFGKTSLGQKPIYPRGCSGCGLWIVHNNCVLLDSIFIEYFEKQHVSFATKIEHIINIIFKSD